MKRFTLLLFFAIAVINGIYAQHVKLEFKNENDSKGYPVLTEIIFKDTLSNTVIKQIDVKALNPFKNIKYPIYEAKSKKLGREVYDLRGKTLKEIVPENVLKLYHFDDPATIYATQGRVSIDKREFKNAVMLKFSWAVGDDSTMFVQNTDMYIYKLDGTEIFSVKNNNINIIDAAIDPQCRYVYYTYGVRKLAIPLLDGGLRIFDLKENHPVMDFPGYEVTIRFMNDNMLYFFYNGQIRDHRPDRWLKVLDFKNMRMYSRCFAFLDMMEIKEINPNGLLYKNDSVEPFYPTFTIENLYWKNYFHDGNYIDYKYYPDVSIESQIKSLVFRNYDQDKILRTLDVAQFNPFRKISFTVFDSVGHNTKFYSLRGNSPYNVLPKEVYESYLPILPKSTALESGRTSISCSGDRNHAFLIFTFSVGIKFENFASYSKLYLFDADGSLLFKYEDKDGYIWDAKLDQEAGYLCYRFAIGNGDTVLKTGYRIWDLKNKGNMTDILTDDATCNFVNPGFLCFYSNIIMKGGKQGTLIQVLDLKNKKTYSKSYNMESIRDIDSYSSEGVMFKNKKTDFFKKDFEEGELSWKKIELEKD